MAMIGSSIACILVVAAAFSPLLCGGFPEILTLERTFPVATNLSQQIEHDRARHGRMLQSSKGVINFTLGGTYDPFQVGIYYTTVQIGTPPRDFHVQVDTGSDVTWVACKSCSTCPTTTGIHNISLNVYDPESSSSSSPISCFDERCTPGVQAPGSTCSAENNSCRYFIRYGDKSETFGFYVLDLLNYDSVVASSSTLKSAAPIIFGCSTVETGFVSPSLVDGIFGFGHQGTSIISQLASRGVSPKAFSHCLRGDGDGGGVLVLGEIVEPNIVYSPLIPSQPHYNLELQRISVNGQILPIDRSMLSSLSERGVIIDSGTTLAHLRSEAFDQFITAINASVSTSARYLPSLDYRPCYLITSSVTDAFPQVTLTFEGGADLILGPQDYLLYQGLMDGAAIWCIGFHRNDDINDPIILGDIVLKNKFFIYDLVGQRIGWTNYDCGAAVNVSTGLYTGKSKPKDKRRSSASTGSVPLEVISWSIIFLLLSMYPWFQI